MRKRWKIKDLPNQQKSRNWSIDNLKLADELNERSLCSSTGTTRRLNKPTFVASCILALGILVFFTATPTAAPAEAQSSISLDLRNADLVDVLRMLAQIGGLNVIISSEVKGTVTVQLDDVSAKDAFAIVFRKALLSESCRMERC